MSMELAFNGIQFEIISRNGHPWVTARQLAQALGYAREDSVLKIYERNKDEFSSMMSATVKMTVGITEVMVRIFSMRGCWLVSMLSRTPVAKQFRRWVLDVLDRLAEEERARIAENVTPSASRPSRRTDPERKALTAIINTWVGMAPIHYANARAQVNAHFGVTGVDKLTVTQVREAIAWVQAKIDALPPAPERLALPSPAKDKFETYIEQVEAFRARTDSEIRRLLDEGLRLVDVYKFGPEGIRGFSCIFHNWLREVAVSPSPLVASYWSMDRAMEYSPLYIVREMEKILPNCLHR